LEDLIDNLIEIQNRIGSGVTFAYTENDNGDIEFKISSEAFNDLKNLNRNKHD
jgi:hypothetical protein